MDKKNQPLVSIGIPFYNSEKFLVDAIKSVVNQTYSYWELILMDDGSTDSSLAIAHEFESKDSRIKVISDGINTGLPSRLNKLSKLANGAYYARMDADDIMFPNRIEDQIKYLIEHPTVDLLGAGVVAIDNDNSIIGVRKMKSITRATLKKSLKGPWAAHPTITGKQEWFKENKYDEKLKRSQDFELWIRTVENSNFVRLSEPLLFYREASTSSIVKYFKATRFSIKIFWKAKNKIGNIGVIKLVIGSLLKLGVYSCFFIFGATNKIIEKRSVKLLAEEKEIYKKLLKKALS
ncbi:MAG: glycosyltransferase [Flavobacteriaceae bacterium]